MKLNSKHVIEVIGIVGIIASLIFVGMQLMLDRRIALAEQYQNRAEMRLQGLLSQFENADWVQDRVNFWESNRPRWLTPELEKEYFQTNQSLNALARQAMVWEMFLINLDNIYFQYQQGLIEDANWQDFRKILKGTLNNPIRQSYYLTTNTLNLNDVIDELVSELESEG